MFFHGVSDADANKSPNKLKGFGSQETSTVSLQSSESPACFCIKLTLFLYQKLDKHCGCHKKKLIIVPVICLCHAGAMPIILRSGDSLDPGLLELENESLDEEAGARCAPVSVLFWMGKAQQITMGFPSLKK